MARPRRSAATAQEAPKRARPVPTDDDSDSSLSSVPDSDDDAPPAKKPRAHTEQPDVADMADNELFHATLHGSVDEASENWVVLYQSESVDALQQLVTFVIRMCGCTSTLSGEDVRASDVDTVFERIQNEYAEYGQAPYPILSRAKPFRGVRKGAAHLVTKLFADAAEADILNDDDFLETWQAWLVVMSSASFRSFRHTSTLVCLWTIHALCEQLEHVRESYDVSVKQRDAEAKRAQGSSRSRLAHTAEKMEQLDALRNTLDDHLDDFLSKVFVPRMRDVDASIRLDCITQLGEWMKAFGAKFVQPAYLRHIGTALSDPDAGVRLHALHAFAPVVLTEYKEQLERFVEQHKKRLMDMALYDVDVHIRTTAFSVLASVNELDLLSHDDHSALAVHIFGLDVKVRHAAAAFLLRLLDQQVQAKVQATQRSEELVRIECLAHLLAEYDEQLGGGSDADVNETLAMIEPDLSRLSLAFEAVAEVADPSLTHSIRPFADVLLDDELAPRAESAAVDMLVTAMRVIKGRASDDEEAAWDESSTYLIDAVPKLLAKYSGDASRISTLVLVIGAMRLDVYNETRNMDAFESLWEDVCTHFQRHVDPLLLQRVAKVIAMLASTPMASNTGASRLLTLKESVLSLLQDTVYQRQVDTTVLSEDDVHNLQASLARLHALFKAMDVSSLLDDEALWKDIVALALRGRLDYPQEQRFVRYALFSLAQDLVWRTKHALDADEGTDELLERRQTVLDVAHTFLERNSPIQATALDVTLMLYTLFFSVSNTDKSESLHMTCPPEIQSQCAALLSTELLTLVPQYHDSPRLHHALLEANVHVLSLASTYVAAVRVGALGVQHAAPMLAYYAWFHKEFDAMCHELIHVMHDDAMHSGMDWVVCETIVDALKRSFELCLLYADDAAEMHFVSLARQLANATMIRGPGFSVVQAIDAQAMITLHIAGIQQFVQFMRDAPQSSHREVLFFKGLAQLCGTLQPADAIKVHAVLQQRLAAAHIEALPHSKNWEPYVAYEKRLVNLAAKDASLARAP